MNGVKIARIVVSGLVFITLAVGFSGICLKAADAAKGEFFPAFAAGSVIFFFWIILAFLWGRVFCSFGCPLGFIQDAAGFIGRKIRRKTSVKQPARRFLRYSAGILLLVIFAAGVCGVIGWFEPFSITGRFFNSVLRPAFQWIGNRTGWWSFSEIVPSAPGIWITAALLMMLIAVAAFFKERFFCNTLCPAGFLLGLFARMARFRIRINEKCVKCKACEKVCKAGCIDVDSGSVDSERCVVCGNCLSVCKFSALGRNDSFRPDRDVPEKLDGKRRLLLTGIAVAGAAGAVGVRLNMGVKKIPCMPPGAGNLTDFNAKCTGCQLCVANCQGKVLTPALFEYGLAGVGQPRMSTENGFCDYECTRCSNICPAGALKPLSRAAKKRVRVGMVTYYRNRCVVVTGNVSCGACAEHCPTGALHMVKYKNDLTIPEVTSELCIGCGGCEYICPVRPERAVVITGAAEQTTAADPAKYRSREETKSSSGSDSDFPF